MEKRSEEDGERGEGGGGSSSSAANLDFRPPNVGRPLSGLDLSAMEKRRSGDGDSGEGGGSSSTAPDVVFRRLILEDPAPTLAILEVPPVLLFHRLHVCPPKPRISLKSAAKEWLEQNGRTKSSYPVLPVLRMFPSIMENPNQAFYPLNLPPLSELEKEKCYGFIKESWTISDAFEGFLSEGRRECPVEDRLSLCRRAIGLINKKYEPDEYELVEAISHAPLCGVLFFHLNFRARCRTPNKNGDESPKLYFVELDTLQDEITSFKCLEPNDDGAPTPESGCLVCGPHLVRCVLYPADKDFLLGSVNNAAACYSYQQEKFALFVSENL